MCNGDIEVSICKPTEADGRLLPQRRGRRGRLRPPGRGRRARRSSARSPYREHDYVVIPRGTTYRWEPRRRRRAALAVLPHARARSRRRTATATATASCSSTRRSRSATSTRRPSSRRIDETRRVRPSRVRVRGGCQQLRPRLPPVRRRRLGRLRLPVHVQRRRLRAARRALPPAAARRTRPSRARTSSSARSRRGCSTGTSTAVPLPYHHSNIQSEEVMFYVEGDYAARKGVDVGLPHAAPVGPAARAAARARSRRRSAPRAPTSSR